MLLTQVELSITREVVDRFLKSKQPSSRRLLVTKYKSPQAIDRLCSFSILKGINRPDQAFLPMTLAFHYSGDFDAILRARTAVEIVVELLQHMFNHDLDKSEFSPADVSNCAHELNESIDSEQIRLALYLLQDFGIYDHWSGTSHLMEISSFALAEKIVTIAEATSVWDEYVARFSAYMENPRPDQLVTDSGLTNAMSAGVELGSVELAPTSFGWPLIHPRIVQVSKSRFDSEHYADAAEASLKLINDRLKNIVKEHLQQEYDGVPLMQKAFSSDKPVLVLGDLSTKIGKDMQIGYQQLFSGAMMAIRNPKAHSIVEIDAVRAMHFIFLASLLMFKIDEALALEAEVSKTVQKEEA